MQALVSSLTLMSLTSNVLRTRWDVVRARGFARSMSEQVVVHPGRMLLLKCMGGGCKMGGI